MWTVYCARWHCVTARLPTVAISHRAVFGEQCVHTRYARNVPLTWAAIRGTAPLGAGTALQICNDHCRRLDASADLCYSRADVRPVRRGLGRLPALAARCRRP